MSQYLLGILFKLGTGDLRTQMQFLVNVVLTILRRTCFSERVDNSNRNGFKLKMSIPASEA
jgi:hypothetical protein